jgi:aspartyl-tRNA(Asn)/glutamyl-tRNA(Gln) amidotransferase subunit A
LRDKKASSVELTEAALARIKAVEPQINAFITQTEEEAMAMAAQADETIAAGHGTPLTGVPAAIKDVIVTKGIRTTAGSKILEPFVPTYDAHAITLLREAGFVLLGKTNEDEFAMGSSGENSAYGITHNPWDLDRVPGGSSSGSAASVASCMAPWALGTDTGGSVRQPAAFCGVVGLKPTYGRISRYGLIAFGSSLDQIGPLARSVRDVAAVLQAIAGHDQRDSTSAEIEVPDFTANLDRGVKGLRVGVPREYFVEGMDASVRSSVEGAIGQLESLGAEIDTDVSLPSTGHAVSVYYIIAPSEASANLARFDGIKYGYSDREGGSMWEDMERTRQFGFGEEVKRRIMIGTYALSAGYYDAFYLKALKVRTLIRREFDAAFSNHDVLITPVTPTPAFKIGEKTHDPLQMYLNDICTIPVSIAGLPGISVPCGFAEEGGKRLPVGLQIIAKPFDEETLFRVAHAYEQSTDWHKEVPPV